MTMLSSRNPDSFQLIPRTGFQAWMAEPARARSPEMDYGAGGP